MNREEKRQLVCQLYTEGKTMREISKEVHMSFSDIGSITKKLNEELELKRKEISIESQALALFKKGNDPVKVALSLDLSPSKTESIYKQYWKLTSLKKLLNLFKKVRDDVSLLSTVHDVMKKYNLTKRDIINIVDYADKRIFLKEDVRELEIQFDHLLKQRHAANDDLMSAKKEYAALLEQIDKYSEINLRKSSQIEDLNSEIKKMETNISLLKNSNEYYTKFEHVAREKFNSITKDCTWILRLAVATVVESLRRDPNKQMIVNNEGITQESYDSHVLDLSKDLFEKILLQLTHATLEDKSCNNDIPQSS